MEYAVYQVYPSYAHRYTHTLFYTLEQATDYAESVRIQYGYQNNFVIVDASTKLIVHYLDKPPVTTTDQRKIINLLLRHHVAPWRDIHALEAMNTTHFRHYLQQIHYRIPDDIQDHIQAYLSPEETTRDADLVQTEPIEPTRPLPYPSTEKDRTE